MNLENQHYKQENQEVSLHAAHFVSKRAIIVAALLFAFIVFGMLTFVVLKKGELGMSYTSPLLTSDLLFI